MPKIPRIVRKSRQKQGTSAKVPVTPIPDLENELGRLWTLEQGYGPDDKETIAVTLIADDELPYCATKVECYPCLLCPKKVYLKSDSLVIHIEQLHPGNRDALVSVIDRIQKYWADQNSRQSDDIAAAEELRQRTEPMRAQLPRVVREIEICRRCGSVIYMTDGNSMNHHLFKHERNDRLREELYRRDGRRFVEKNLVCKRCDLVFHSHQACLEHVKCVHNGKVASPKKPNSVVTNGYAYGEFVDVDTPISVTTPPSLKAEDNLPPPVLERMYCGAPYQEYRIPQYTETYQYYEDDYYQQGVNFYDPSTPMPAFYQSNEEAVHLICNPQSSNDLQASNAINQCSNCQQVFTDVVNAVDHVDSGHKCNYFAGTVNPPDGKSFDFCVDVDALSYICCGIKFENSDLLFNHRELEHDIL